MNSKDAEILRLYLEGNDLDKISQIAERTGRHLSWKIEAFKSSFQVETQAALMKKFQEFVKGYVPKDQPQIPAVKIREVAKSKSGKKAKTPSATDGTSSTDGIVEHPHQELDPEVRFEDFYKLTPIGRSIVSAIIQKVDLFKFRETMGLDVATL